MGENTIKNENTRKQCECDCKCSEKDKFLESLCNEYKPIKDNLRQM